MSLPSDHHLVRAAKILLWLDNIRESIELQAPPSARKDDALRRLDAWIEDLPIFRLLKNRAEWTFRLRSAQWPCQLRGRRGHLTDPERTGPTSGSSSLIGAGPRPDPTIPRRTP
jgi:hypothetical protein